MTIITTKRNGRLGNQIIRNLAVSFIAKNHDLKVRYSSAELINKLGIELYCGILVYTSGKVLNDKNYFETLNIEKLEYKLDPNKHFFQTHDIT